MSDTPRISHTVPGPGARLHAPAAERNMAPLTDLLTRFAPRSGRALELASGTGQHVAAFANALPDLIWQPTEPDANRRASIDAWAAGLPNVRPAQDLDACTSGWSAHHIALDLVLAINLLHLVSVCAAKVLVTESARALAPNGCLVLYGPFKRGGALTSDGDRRFDAAIRAAHPGCGYKDDRQIANWLARSGLRAIDTVEMPANNLAFVAGHD